MIKTLLSNSEIKPNTSQFWDYQKNLINDKKTLLQNIYIAI